MTDQTSELVIHQSVEPMHHPHIPRQAHDDETLVRLWLDGRTANTRRAYEEDVSRFRAFLGRPIRSASIGDVQAYAATVAHLAPATRCRRLGSVKSLLTFAMRIGYVTFNVGAAVRLPPIKNVLPERILRESDILRLLELETNPRNHAALALMYFAGLRISEACGLRWRDAVTRDEAGQINVLGKGGKTGAILLPGHLWLKLAALRGEAGPDAPMFLSAKGGHLDPVQVHRIVKAAAARAGLSPNVSAHWLRHAHASHALDRGAPIHVVQQTLRHSSVATTGKYAHARPNDSSARYLAT